ncbi:MAG: hypothetical protein ABSG62_18000 [Terracidiphilus sp.]
MSDYYEKSPELEGMLDLEDHLRLAERGYEIYKLGAVSELGPFETYLDSLLSGFCKTEL